LSPHQNYKTKVDGVVIALAEFYQTQLAYFKSMNKNTIRVSNHVTTDK